MGCTNDYNMLAVAEVLSSLTEGFNPTISRYTHSFCPLIHPCIAGIAERDGKIWASVSPTKPPNHTTLVPV